MKNRLPFLLKSLLFMLIINAFGNKLIGQEEKFKALFIYNFTKYIEWPLDMGGDNFNIVVLGNIELANQLMDISSKMKVGSKKMNVIISNSIDEIPNCQIVIFGSSKTEQLAAFAQKVKGNKVLIVCDKDKSCQKGACINFIKKNGNLNYEISKSNMDGANLKYNSTLTALGSLLD